MTTSSSVASDIVVLDTNVVSELMRGNPDEHVQRWALGLETETICITAVTLAEIRFGIARLPDGRRKALLGNAADEVFEAFADHVLSFDAAAADQYADVVMERERSGTPIAGFDAQIAAICRVHRAPLATRNTRDFVGVGLKVIDPWLARA